MFIGNDGFPQTHAQMEVMAVTSMLFVRLPKARTSARVKQVLRETDINAKVPCLLFDLN